MAPTGLSGGPKIIEGMFTFEVDLYKASGARLGLDVLLFRSQSGSSLIVESVTEGGIVEAWNQQSQEPIRIRPGDFIVKVNGVEGDMSALSGVLQTGREFHITVQRVAQGGSPPGGFGGNAPCTAVVAPPAQPKQPAVRMPQTALSTSLALNPINRVTVPHGNPPLLDHNAGDGGLDTTTSTAASDMNQFTCEVVLFRRESAKLGIDVLPVTTGEICGLSVKCILKGGVVDEWNQCCRKNFNIRPGDCIIRVNDVAADLASMMEELRTQQELRLTVIRGRGTAGNPVGAPPAPVGSTNLADLVGGPGGSGVSGPGGGGQFWGTMPGLPEPSTGNWGFGLGGSKGNPAPLEDTSIPVQCTGTPNIANSGRLLRFDVELERKPYMRLGLDVMLVKGNGLCDLVVERVASGGSVDQWNQRSRPPHCVQAGDYIVQVNGIGNWQALARIADAFSRDPQTVHFVVQRGHEPMITTPVPAPMVQNWTRPTITALASVAAGAPVPPPYSNGPQKVPGDWTDIQAPAVPPPPRLQKVPGDWADIQAPAVPPPPRIGVPPGLGSTPSFPKEPHILSAKAAPTPCPPPVFESYEPPDLLPKPSLGLPSVPQTSLASSTFKRDRQGSIGNTIHNNAGTESEGHHMHSRPPPGLDKIDSAFLEPDLQNTSGSVSLRVDDLFS